MEERLALAERDLDHIRLLVSQQAADQLALLDATIAAAEQRNALDALRAGLALDTTRFLADLDLPAARWPRPIPAIPPRCAGRRVRCSPSPRRRPRSPLPSR